MSDRIKGLVITLDKDYRDDDVQVIVNAIKMIKGVVTVDTSLYDISDSINRNRIKMELEEKIWDIFK